MSGEEVEVWLAGRVIGFDSPDFDGAEFDDAGRSQFPGYQALHRQVNGNYVEWTDGPEVSNEELVDRTRQLVLEVCGPSVVSR